MTTTATAPAPAATTGTAWPARRLHLDVLASWLVARVVVGLALALSRYVSDQSAAELGRSLRTVGLLGWDAGWYRSIAANGYAGAGPESVRFFPLVPLLARWLGLGSAPGPALLVLANAGALAFGFAFVRLARAEGWSATVTSRAVWLLALAPPAFVLVMGYAEAISGLLAVLVFLGLRTRRWELAIVAGLLAGLCRPVGLLLVVPAAIEAGRGLAAAGGTERARRLAAVVAPAVGAGIYLLWAGAQYGSVLKPIRVQQESGRHGQAANPFRVVGDAIDGTVHGRLGTGLHVPWLILFVVLLVLMARRLPSSYTAWSAVTLVAVLTGTNLDSSERYAYGAFAFVVVAAMLLRDQLAWRAAIVVSTSALTVYALLAFLGFYVP